MTLCHPFSTALALCGILLVTPGMVGAASLSPLDNHGPGANALTLDDMPGLPEGPATEASASRPIPVGSAPFKFVEDTGLDSNPMRDILPENQWANPQAARNGLIQRR